MAEGYMVMRTHNAETQHWRGLLCGYEVIRGSCVRARGVWVSPSNGISRNA